MTPNNNPTTKFPYNQVIEQRALSLPDEARTLTIFDQRTYDSAAAALRKVLTVRKEITDYHAPLKKAAHEAHQLICEAETGMLKPVAEAERILKSSIGKYEQEQSRLQEELRLKARREAEERAEVERHQQIAEAEANTKRQLDAAMEEADTFEEACAIADAREPALSGARQEAKSEPMPVISYEIEPTIYRHPGVYSVTIYAAEVENIKELCRAVADGKASVELILPNMPALNKIAKALKEHFSIPGCRVVKSNDVRGKSLPRNR